MTKLYELLRLRKRQDGDFGIEIECEGKDLAVPHADVWRTDDDGSLRGVFPHSRAEWVLARPLSLDNAIKAVDELSKFQIQHKAQLDFSFRTSVHVHMNVQNLTFNQYLNTIYTYLLLENVLVRYCGNDRIGNRFCLRMQDAEGLSELIMRLFKEGPRGLGYFNEDAAKYASINIAATNNYGSLEFRAMQGNLQVPYISTWLKALYNLREFAKARHDPQDIHDFFVRTTPSEFMQAVLKDTYPFFSYEDEENDIRYAFSITLDLPYAFVDEDHRKRQLQEEIKRQEEAIRKRFERDEQRLKQQMQDAIVRLHGRDGVQPGEVFFRNVREDLPAPKPLRVNDILVDDIFE